MRIFIIFSILGVVAVSEAFSQEGVWDIYTSSSMITCVAPLDDFVWCGTSGGVLRVNRSDWSSVKYTVKDGLINNSIQTVAVDQSGIVWVGTYFGVSSFDGKAWKRYTTADGLAQNNVQAIAIDTNNVKWFGTGDNGISSFDGVSWKTYSLTDMVEFGSVSAIAVDGNNVKWIASYNALLSFDGSSWKKYYLNGIKNVKIGPDGSVWVIQHTSNFDNLMKLVNGVFKEYLHGSDSKGSSYFPDFAVGQNGKIWLSQEGMNAYYLGLIEFNGTSWKNYTVQDGLLNMRPRALSLDRRGVLWICSYNGLSRFDDSIFTSFTDKSGPYNNGISGVFIDSKNRVWCSTNSGISLFDGVNWTNWNENSGLASLSTYAIAVSDDGTAWIGTSAGVSRYDGATWKTYTSNDGLLDTLVNTVAVDKKGVVWFGSNKGITRYDGKDFVRYPGSYTSSISVDDNNVKWFATWNGGVIRFDDLNWKTWGAESGLTFQRYRSISAGKNGVVWVGADGGAARFDGTSWKTYTTADGLCNNDVRSIAVDRDGVVWIGTFTGGVSAFDGKSWKTYTTLNGLADNRVVSIAVDVNNVKWFGTFVGISAYRQQTGPSVWITSPRGGELWETDTAQKILWTSSGVKTVVIEYSQDGGVTWKSIAGNVDASLGSYPWTLTGIESTKCLVRITDTSNSAVKGSSYAVFAVSRPFIKVTSPNGGERLIAGSVQPITWNSLGSKTVRIEFSSDSGKSWKTVTESVDAAKCYYSWTVPVVSSSSTLVRITDATSSQRTDTSDGVFSITVPTLIEEISPKEFAVFQNTPNPFNPKTTITFTLPQAGQVSMNVYNLAGQRVDSILDGRLSAGRHTVAWNAARFSAGIYFFLVRTEKEAKTIKMLLLK
ncbi:MAG: two-component regulator propeller domain-containing protein [Candidatus Latescibacter sp.]|nr:two-component regulator propeller domain-containing protein [Candidatus Latescibacter sp.]